MTDICYVNRYVHYLDAGRLHLAGKLDCENIISIRKKFAKELCAQLGNSKLYLTHFIRGVNSSPKSKKKEN